MQNRDKALDVITQFTGVSKDVVDEAFKHATLEYRVDVQTAVCSRQGRAKVRLHQDDMSDKVASYFDLSYLAEATGTPIGKTEPFLAMTRGRMP